MFILYYSLQFFHNNLSSVVLQIVLFFTLHVTFYWTSDDFHGAMCEVRLRSWKLKSLQPEHTPISSFYAQLADIWVSMKFEIKKNFEWVQVFFFWEIIGGGQPIKSVWNCWGRIHCWQEREVVTSHERWSCCSWLYFPKQILIGFCKM